MKIEFNNFGGIMPRYEPKMLPDHGAVQAQNVELLGGKLVPLSGLSMPVSNEGVYRVKGPIVDDEYDRYYSTNGSGPLLVENGANPEAKFPIPPAPTGERVVAFEDIITSSVKCFCRPALGIEEEMTFLELLDGDDENSKKIRFRYSGAVSDTPFNGFVDSYYQLHITDEKFLPDAFSSSPADGTYIEIRNDDNEVVSRYYIESHNKYASVTPDNPGSLPNILYGHDVEFVIRNRYTDTIKDNYYLYRYVDTLGIEGPPSELSEMLTCYPGEVINLTNIPSGATGMAKVRIYRSAGTEEAAGFYYVGEADLGSETFTDDVSDSDLAEEMPNYGNPPDGMDNLTLCSGGILAANKGKDIYFCDPYLPHTWVLGNAVNVDDNPVAMAARRNTLLVMTDVKLHMFSGNDPESMLPVELAFNHPCVAQEGVVKIDGNVFYPSDDGLARVGNDGFSIVTSKAFTKDDWQDLKPDTFVSKEYNNKYFARNSDGLSIIIDINEGIITTYTDGVSAEWTSKVFCIDKIMSFSYIKLVADDYPVTVDFITGGVSVLELEILDSNPKRIPVLRNETEWQFKITTQFRVDSLILATSGAEI